MDDNQDRESLFQKHRENKYFRWGLTAFLVIAACIVVAQFVTKISDVFEGLGKLVRTLSPVFYGLGIAYILDPVVTRVQKRLEPWLKQRLRQNEKAPGLARGIGILLALALVVLIVWALLAMILPQLLDSLNTIIGNLPDYYETMRSWVSDLIDDNLEVADFTGEIMERVYEYFTSWLTTTMLPRLQSFVVSLTSSVVSMARALLNLIIGLIISVYLLMGKNKFLSQAKKLTYSLLGEKRGGYFCNICTFANRAFGGFIGGKILDSAIIGFLCFIGMSILRIPYPLLISVIVGVTNVIPFFGPYLGAIPSILLLLVIDPLHALYFIIFIVVLQQVDGNIIGPKILGSSVGINGFWVMFSIILGAGLFGFWGMLLGVPVFVVIYTLINKLIVRKLERSDLPSTVEAYQDLDHIDPITREPVKRRAARAAAPKEKTEPEDNKTDKTAGM